jgi:hypothetical protein
MAAGVVGCSASGASPDIDVDWPAPTPEQWVDPARCLVRCEDAAADRLVSVDAAANVDPAGTERVLDLVRPALAAMLSAASRQGHVATVGSAFRTYDTQLTFFRDATEIGRTARPGHSEHQLGTTVDVRAEDGATYAWLAGACARFGFLLSFPERLQKITGLRYEPWHFRYVGTTMARAVLGETTTLEAYLHAHPDAAVTGDCSACPSDLSRSECGSVTRDGECQGPVLTWCFDGALAQVDCTTTGLACTSDASGADCR